ncbi:MAG: hypothetical protein LBM99_01390 [Bacillales bacterium]|jgi:hypothetical protein|nr:hypothetical protein [Bacillales bacterium]
MNTEEKNILKQFYKLSIPNVFKHHRYFTSEYNMLLDNSYLAGHIYGVLHGDNEIIDKIVCSDFKKEFILLKKECSSEKERKELLIYQETREKALQILKNIKLSNTPYKTKNIVRIFRNYKWYIIWSIVTTIMLLSSIVISIVLTDKLLWWHYVMMYVLSFFFFAFHGIANSEWGSSAIGDSSIDFLMVLMVIITPIGLVFEIINFKKDIKTNREYLKKIKELGQINHETN